MNWIGRVENSDIEEWIAQTDSFDILDWIEWAEGSGIEGLTEWVDIADIVDWIVQIDSFGIEDSIAWTDFEYSIVWADFEYSIAQIDSFGTADWTQLCFVLSPFDSIPFVYSRPHSSLAPSALASHPSPLHSLSASPPPQLQTVPSLSLHSDSPLYSHCY